MKKYILLSLLLITLIIRNANAENKIVYLISPPRSMSTVFLRMMENRGDFIPMNEPFTFAFWKNSVEYTPEGLDWYTFCYDDAPTNYEEVKPKIAINLNRQNVCIKEMSFTFDDVSDLDERIITNPNAYFVFLVRDPHGMIISFYKKLIQSGGFSASDLEPVGYESSCRVLEKVKTKGKHLPIIIKSEDLGSYPEKIVSTLCEKLGLSFDKSKLEWPNLGEDFDGRNEWGNLMRPKFVQLWHGDAIKSTKFIPLKNYVTDNQNVPTFSEVAGHDDRLICQEVYARQLKFYELLLAEKEFFIVPKGSVD